jgi:S-adenosylmethionine:tRNA ribosyltransferase-isomerase
MLRDPRLLRIADYTYDLPDERIARHPLPERDAAKLLVYRNGSVESARFRYLARFIPENSLLILNNAKVVRARLFFRKPTGGVIEIFCLEPAPVYADITTAMARTGTVDWQCLVGGAAKWKPDAVLEMIDGEVTLKAELLSRNDGNFTIRFSWSPDVLSFSEVLEQAGKIPLPPYIDRDADDDDASRYQTLFAAHEGSVAAPTASLHFTPGVMHSLREMAIQTGTVTLHVGAGTFMPVKSEAVGDHRMHQEWIEIGLDTLELLVRNAGNPVVAAGTTALRTLESLYWIGCKILQEPDIQLQSLVIEQWDPYDCPDAGSAEIALRAVQEYMERHQIKKLITRTGILIAPGYHFRIVTGLITNFHQPQSTLLLLIAAFIGPDWRKVYNYALEHDYRFLSYGDGSLLWRIDGE